MHGITNRFSKEKHALKIKEHQVIAFGIAFIISLIVLKALGIA